MSKLFSFKPGLKLSGRKFKGMRGWAGKPSHPPLTDFPIVAYVLVAGFDTASYLSEGNPARELYAAGHFVLISGLIVSAGAALTGFWDWWKGMSRSEGGLFGRAARTQTWRTANTHMAIMLTVTAVAVIDLILRMGAWSDPIAPLSVMILSLVAAGLVTLGAFYGGELVYDFGFNVEVAGDSPVWHESEVDLEPGQEDFPAARP